MRISVAIAAVLSTLALLQPATAQTGNVIKIDAATQGVTLKGPERTVDLKVRDPAQFRLIAVGDQIEATCTEAIAVAVTPAAKPAAKAAPKK